MGPAGQATPTKRTRPGGEGRPASERPTQSVPETSRAGIIRIGCEGSLSALRSDGLPPYPPDQTRKAPLFRRGQLDHKSPSTRKRGPVTQLRKRALFFVRSHGRGTGHAAHSGTMSDRGTRRTAIDGHGMQPASAADTMAQAKAKSAVPPPIKTVLRGPRKNSQAPHQGARVRCRGLARQIRKHRSEDL